MQAGRLRYFNHGSETRATPDSRERAELVAVRLAAFEAGDALQPVAIGNRGVQRLQFVLILPQGAQDFVAILLQNRAPELRVAGGNARGVAQSTAGVVAPGRVFLGEKCA